MMTDTAILVLSAILTWLMLCTASGLRIRALQPGGIARAFGNRDDLGEPTPLAGGTTAVATPVVPPVPVLVPAA